MELRAFSLPSFAGAISPRSWVPSVFYLRRTTAAEDSYQRKLWARQYSMSNMFSWQLVTKHLSLREGNSAFLLKPSLCNQILEKRGRGPLCATANRIEAEKAFIDSEAKGKLEKAIEAVRFHFNSVRAGRANPAMLDRLEVEYRGNPVKVRSIAEISTPDSRSILVQPHDKSCLKAIEKAIVLSDLRLTPNNDGEKILIHISQLTSERRKELLKVIHKQAEEGKAAVRNIRRDALKAYENLHKEKKLSEDNVKDLSIDFQKVADEYMKKINTILLQKEKELTTM